MTANGTIPLLRDLPDRIPPLPGCDALIVTCLTAPAETIDARGLEVQYRGSNDWRKEIRP